MPFTWSKKGPVLPVKAEMLSKLKECIFNIRPQQTDQVENTSIWFHLLVISVPHVTSWCSAVGFEAAGISIYRDIVFVSNGG